MKSQASSCGPPSLRNRIEDGDALAAGEFGEINVMSAAGESQVDAVVDEAFAFESFADTRLDHHVHSSLLEDTGADALFDILAAAIFDYDGFNSLEVEQVREDKTRGAGANG